MKKLSAEAMAARASQVGSITPSLQDRVEAARSFVGNHPLHQEQEAPHPHGMTAAFGETEVAPIAGPAGVAVISHVDGGYLADVPLELIDENPYNARQIYRQTRVAKLVESIGKHGQETPGTATIRGGRYILVAGHYRRKALSQLRHPTMRLMIREGLSDQELYEVSFRENNDREGHSALDNALSWSRLLKDGVYPDEASLAKSLDQSPANINKTLAILKLSEPLRELISAAEDPTVFAMSALYELTLLEKEAGEEGKDQTLAIVMAIAAGQAGRKEVKELRDRIQARKAREPKAFGRRYDIQRDGYVGRLREWDKTGKVQLELVIADPVARAKFVEEIRMKLQIETPQGSTTP